jgi:ribose/xylose/arabinose/galactoside ABC-type transport system permease subunit
VTATTARWRDSSGWSRRLEGFLASGGVVWLLVGAIVLVAAILSEDFRTLQNLANVSRQAVVLALVALGQLVVVLTAGVDLSLGMIVRLTAIGTAVGISGYDERTLPALFFVLVLSALVGTINGLVVTRLKVPPFIATFGMLAVLQGLLLVVASTPQGKTGKTLYDLWASQLTIDRQGIHVVVIATLGIYLVMHLALTRTVWGRHVFAVGADERIAAHSGVRVRSIKLSVYVVAALLAGLGGAITAARAGVGDPNAGFGLEFESLAAVVIGGASLAGGRGTVTGVLGGVVLLTVMGNVFNIVGIDVWYQQLIKGALILIGAAAYVARDERARA